MIPVIQIAHFLERKKKKTFLFLQETEKKNFFFLVQPLLLVLESQVLKGFERP